MSQNTTAQNGYITGAVIDYETQDPILGASVRVLQRADSTFVTGQATRLDGTFSIPISNGAYIVHISFIGYEDLFRDVQVSDEVRRVQLETVAMRTDAVLLDELAVSGLIPEIIMRGDTVEFNADAFRVTEGAVLEELIEQLPGIEISQSGQITHQGRRIARFMLDDEEFFGTDMATALENLPADMIERIQVAERQTDRARMTGFTDGEEEIVINLVTRPGRREMWQGNARVAYGNENNWGDRWGANLNTMYMRNNNRYVLFSNINNTNGIGMGGGGGGRGGGMGGGDRGDGITTTGNLGGDVLQIFSPQFRIGGSLGYNYRETVSESEMGTLRFLQAGNIWEEESRTSTNIRGGYNLGFRMEWRPNEQTEMIFRSNAGFNENRSESARDFLSMREVVTEGDTIRINEGFTRNSSEGSGNNFGGSLNISRRFDTPGRVLNVVLNASTNDSESESLRLQHSYFHFNDSTSILDQRISNVSTSHSWGVNASFVEPLGDNRFLQIAYSIRQNYQERDMRTYDDGETDPNPLFSLRSENLFTTHTMEANFRAVRGIWNYRVGMRVHPSSSVVWADRLGEVARDATIRVTNFAPVAELNARWSRSHTLLVRYNGTTVHPSIDQLSPIEDISDPLNITQGNPYLKPSFTHHIHTRYNLGNPERARSMSVNADFRYFTNAIAPSTYTDLETGGRFRTFENVGSGNWTAGGSVTLNSPIREGSRFTLSSTTNANYSRMNGFINAEMNISQVTNISQRVGVNYRGEMFDFSLRGNVSSRRVANTIGSQPLNERIRYGGTFNTRVFLPWRIVIATDLNYSAEAGDVSPNFRLNEWLWNAQIQKTVFRQNNGTISINAFDILQQRRNITSSINESFMRDSWSNSITSFFLVSFNYRFSVFRGGATPQNMMRGMESDRERMMQHMQQQQGGGGGRPF